MTESETVFVPRRCINKAKPCGPTNMTFCTTCPNDFPSLSLMQRPLFFKPRIKVVGPTPKGQKPIWRCSTGEMLTSGGFQRITVDGYGMSPTSALRVWKENAERARKQFA